MSHETETKFKVAGHAAVRRRLRAAGATYLGTVLQTDCYYDTPERMLLGRECGLRIRRARSLRRGADKLDARPLLTVKGPGKGTPNAKVRRELQTHLDDPAAVEEIFEAVGLAPTMTVQKRRASYRLGRCLVELDELPLIGCFVEIEAPSEKAILAVSRQLHLAGPPITDHYVNLVLAARRRGGNKRTR